MRIDLPNDDTSRIFIDTLVWSWLAAFASALLLDTLISRQPYLHFTVTLVSVAVAFGALFIGYLATHAAYSRWAVVAGLAFALAMHGLAWRRWRRRTLLKLGVLDEAMRERLAPESRFPSNASAFERCDWRVVSEAMPFDQVDGVVLPDDQHASIRQGAALRAKLAGTQVYSESFIRALLTGRLDIERADDVFLDDVPTNLIYISVKRGLDIVGALALGVFALPVTLVCLALIRLESPGRALLVQPRIGLRGAVFGMRQAAHDARGHRRRGRGRSVDPHHAARPLAAPLALRRAAAALERAARRHEPDRAEAGVDGDGGGAGTADPAVRLSLPGAAGHHGLGAGSPGACHRGKRPCGRSSSTTCTTRRTCRWRWIWRSGQ